MKDKEQRVGVGLTIPKDELDEMKRVIRVDLSSTAVLSLARKGLEVEKKRIAEELWIEKKRIAEEM